MARRSSKRADAHIRMGVSPVTPLFERRPVNLSTIMRIGVKRGEAEAGFTILEVLLSVVIVALVLTMIYSAFSAGSKACRFGSERAQIFHTARLAMQDIIQSIENLEYGTNKYYEFIGKSHTAAGPAGKSVDNDELEFATSTSPTLFDGRWHAGLARVKYAINRGRRGAEGAKLEKWVTRIDDEDFDDAYVIELSDNIVGMKFRYFDETDYDDTWDSDVKERLPELVEITFYAQEGERVHPFMSGALIPDMRVKQGKKTVSNIRDKGEPSPDEGEGKGKEPRKIAPQPVK